MSEVTIDPRFDSWRSLIDNMIRAGIEWNDIAEHCSREQDGLLQETLDSIADTNFTDRITMDQWKLIVSAKKRAYDESVETDRHRTASFEDAVLGKEVDSEIQLSGNPRSCWMTYREGLEDKGFDEESIQNIASSSSSTLRRMSRNTINQPAKKGMVVGHVQSGKTANMAGLMAIGADNGYNFFIVLSGTIENLRRQTQERLFNDLNNRGNIAWQSLEDLRNGSPVGSRLCDLHLNIGDQQRYMTVLLKNYRRLNNLLQWLNRDNNNIGNMKLVIIDDEADQAGVNTACVDEERTRINQLIVNLTEVKACAVNYVAFTATPYANFLNEAYPESLYPKDFILTLPQPKKHFGPAQIFGLEGRMQEERILDGLDVIREIRKEELPLIKDIHADAATSIPDSMKDSVSWFLCTAAATRHLRDTNPRTMLIHTSCRTAHHKNIASALYEWLNDKEDVYKRCIDVWDMETKRLDKDKFASQFPSYPGLDTMNNYPKYSEIFPNIEELLENVTHIQIDDNDIINYHQGIHLCIDNSTEEEIIDGLNQHVRLLYPSGTNTCLDFSPAFIVIGGNTLSRGLTLEGLTSTYFIRSSSQMDTLMQMGRWFGFRRGYELLPRIWMTEDTLLKFRYMTLAEQELREELRTYMEPPFVDPSEIAPRVKNSPSFSWLRPTARNRMQSAEQVDLDFSGASPQTTIFYRDPEILKRNLQVTDAFLRELSSTAETESDAWLVWKGVSFEKISVFLKHMTFHPRSRLFSDIDAFVEWYVRTAEETEYADWNVVAAGVSNTGNSEESWQIGDFTIGKVNRSKKLKESGDESISIGALRNPSDLLADLNCGRVTGISRISEIIQRRRNGGLAKTPQLLIYRISKNSQPKNYDRIDRGSLETDHDVIGISLWIPLVRNERGNINFATGLQMNIPYISLNSPEDSPLG